MFLSFCSRLLLLSRVILKVFNLGLCGG
ncbi:hypothetical protein FOXYSP1_09330 [Fusarium oxysporum f. sp. phaseoli]